MSIEHKVQNETGRNPYRIGTNVLLLVAFFLLFHPLLSRGSLMYQPTISHWLTAGAFVPLVLRPWRRNHPFAENHTRLYAAVLLVHDVLLFLSAAAVSLILVEYMVKGCVITLKQSFFQGWICYVAVYAAAYLICGNVRVGVCLGMAISMIHGMIDHYVMLFRGTPVMLSDIAAIGTAANVSKGYSAPIELSVLRAAAAAVLFCVSVCLMQRSFKVHKRWYFRRLFSLPCLLVLAFIAYTGIQTVGTGLAFWQSSRQYSEIFYFLRCATSSFVKQPEGYSADSLSDAQSEFTGKQGTKTPNLIVIMNESFSDLGSVGALETNEDPMPYVHKLMQGQENTISGQLTVSTFGGGTANTELEFLTGDSMAFLPYNCSAYQVFIKSEMPNLASGLDSLGYQTAAIHPYLSTSWNRTNVYRFFGFEAQYYQDDFAADAGRVRDYISDSASYKKIFELYESKRENTPLFVFNVTMQNHGGYDWDGDGYFDKRIYLTGKEQDKYPTVDQYLSLVRYSDDAVQELISYFSKVDEPTAAGGLLQHPARRRPPFFIWANYDIKEQTNCPRMDGDPGFDQMRLALHKIPHRHSLSPAPARLIRNMRRFLTSTPSVLPLYVRYSDDAVNLLSVNVEMLHLLVYQSIQKCKKVKKKCFALLIVDEPTAIDGLVLRRPSTQIGAVIHEIPEVDFEGSPPGQMVTLPEDFSMAFNTLLDLSGGKPAATSIYLGCRVMRFSEKRRSSSGRTSAIALVILAFVLMPGDLKPFRRSLSSEHPPSGFHLSSAYAAEHPVRRRTGIRKRHCSTSGFDRRCAIFGGLQQPIQRPRPERRRPTACPASSAPGSIRTVSLTTPSTETRAWLPVALLFTC